MKVNHEFVTKRDYSERARFVNALRKFPNLSLLGLWSGIIAPTCERCIQELLLLAIGFVQCLCDVDNSVIRVSRFVDVTSVAHFHEHCDAMLLKVTPPPPLSNRETKALQTNFPSTSCPAPLLQKLWKPARRDDWFVNWISNSNRVNIFIIF